MPSAYTGMQAQAGLTPQGLPQLPPPMFPSAMPTPVAPHPMQVAGMLQQQTVMQQYSMPQPMNGMHGSTMLAQPGGMFAPAMPPPMYGMARQARQRGLHEAASTLAIPQAGVGLGLRLAGGAAASYFGGPLGSLAYEGLGIGQMMQNAGNKIFEPIVQQRERALNLQNQSIGFVTGGSGLSMTGQGLSSMAATQVSMGLGRMADSSAFRRETGNMFNRGDLDRITRMAGEMGMLDNAQGADQMLREVKRVSKAVSNFMRIIEEPDLQKAMKQMGQLRSMGFMAAEMPSAASNARTFARMAGVSTETAMTQAVQGGEMFQRAGLSGASGFQASLGAQGMARQLANTMTARQLNMAGGVEGIQQNMMQGALSSATNDPFMMAMLTRRDGQLSIDSSRMRDLMSGRMSISDVMRQGASNIRGLGGRAAIDEMFTRRNELNDQLTSAMGPQGQMLLPLLQARMIQRQTGGSLGEALRQNGMGEQQARTYEQMAQNPEFWTNMRRQIDASMREHGAERRNQISERSGFRATLGRRAHHAVGRHFDALGSGFMDPIQRMLAEEQDNEEALAMTGEGPGRVVRGDRFATETFAAGTRDLLRSGAAGRSAMEAARRRMARNVAGEDARAEAVQGNILARQFFGAHGFGLTRNMRGGETARETIMQGADAATRVEEFFGQGPSASNVRAMGRDQAEMSGLLDRAQSGTAEERAASSRRGASLFGDRTGRAQAIAIEATRNVVSDSHTFGFRTGNTGRAAFTSRIEQRLMAAGYSRDEARQATANEDFMQRVTNEARSSMDEEGRQVLDQIGQQGRNADSARLAQGNDMLRRDTERRRENFMSNLGLDTWVNASTEDVSRVSDVLGGSDDEATLRQQLFAAELMSRSDDAQTRQRGQERKAQLERSADEEVFRRVNQAVQTAINGMDESTREDMSKKLEGRTSAQAERTMAQAGREVTAMQANEATVAERRVLGDQAQSAFSTGGVAALRRDPSKVRNRNVQRMLQDGHSTDAEIESAIREQAVSATRAETTATAEGGGASAEDQEGAANAEAMINAITSGMEEFPTAVNTFSEASRTLLRAAEAMGGAESVQRLAGGLRNAH